MTRSEPKFDSGQRHNELNHDLHCEDCGEYFQYVCGCHPEGPK